MFCGNCGAQVPDGSAVCPNCGAQLASQTQAPQMNQSAQYQNSQFQNPQGGFQAQGAPAGKAPSKINGKLIGIIVACVAVVAVLIFLVTKLFGGSGLKGVYTDGSSIVKFEKGRMIIIESGLEMSFEYKTKKDQIIVDPESMKFSDNFWEVLADSLGVDEDDLEDTLEEYADWSDEMEALYEAYKDDDMDSLVEYFVDEMDYDEDNLTFEYDKKNNVLKNKSTKEKFYYAENYKEGPSGKYVNKEDDDISLTFKNGTVTFDDDGDKETFTYYVYVIKSDVYVLFSGEDFMESEFKEDHPYVSSFDYNAKKDKFEIDGEEYKK